MGQKGGRQCARNGKFPRGGGWIWILALLVDPAPAGPGGDQATDEPGGPLPPELNFEWSTAQSLAASKARGDRQCCLNGRPYYIANECRLLFTGNPMGSTGQDLIDDYLNPRWGEGVRDAQGNVPCDTGVALWTTCCNHDPDVFVCDSFGALSTSTQAALIIHEALHVAGQPEDTTFTAGPDDDHPTTSQISATVGAACGL